MTTPKPAKSADAPAAVPDSSDATAPVADAPAAPVIPQVARINGARAWILPKQRTEEKMLTGTLVAVTRRENPEYGAYPCVIIDTDPSKPNNPLTAFHAFHTVAKEQLKALKPSPGENITIVAHVPVKTRKRVDAKGDPIDYTPYTIFNPDAPTTVASNWSWEDEEDSTEPGY